MFTGDQNNGLISRTLVGSSDVRAQLLCKSGDNLHSQSLALREVEVSSQPNTIVAHRYERGISVFSSETDVNMPGRAIFESILDGVCDELVHDQSQRNSSIGREPNSTYTVEVKLAVRTGTNRVRTHRL